MLFHLAADDGESRLERAEAMVKDVLRTLDEHYTPVDVKDLLLPDGHAVLEDCLSNVTQACYRCLRWL